MKHAIRKKYVLLLLMGLLLLSCSNKQISYNISTVTSLKGTEQFKPNWDNIAENYKFPSWYTNAKFGIFIHWGVYSVPAFGNEWYSRNMYIKGSSEYEHHRKTYGDQAKFGYKDFIPMFKAEKFNADEWADLFKESGAKYVVPVAEHHDGFSMYNSDLNKWNSVKMGPKKDIIGLLKKAIEKRGMYMGLSTHRAENAWFFNGGMKFPSDVQDSTITLYGKRYDDQVYTEEWAKDWLEHTYELVVKYEPKLIFFDWTVNNPVLMPYFNHFLAFYYNNALDWKKEVVVNTKQGYPTNIMVWDIERGKTDRMMKYPWQTDTFVGTKSWGYITDEVYKTPGQIVDDLVDIVSKNGNLMLNIGPKADGTIPEEQQHILRSIGQWLKINGEAIYGTNSWKRFGEGDTKTTKGSFSDNAIVDYTPNDIRFTTKGTDFFAISLSWGKGDVIIKTLTPDVIGDANIKSVTMLGSSEPIIWKQSKEGLVLTFPKEKPCDYAFVFKIAFDKMIGENLQSDSSNVVLKHGA